MCAPRPKSPTAPMYWTTAAWFFRGQPPNSPRTRHVFGRWRAPAPKPGPAPKPNSHFGAAAGPAANVPIRNAGSRLRSTSARFRAAVGARPLSRGCGRRKRLHRYHGFLFWGLVRARGGVPPYAHGSSQSRRQRGVWSRSLLKASSSFDAARVGYGLIGRWTGLPPPLRTEGPRSKGKSRNRIEKIIRFVDKTGRSCAIDRAGIEGGRLEHFDHFASDLVAPLGDRIDQRLERCIGRVVALERGRRDPGQSPGAQCAARRVDLLIRFGQSRERVLMLTQGIGDCLVIERLEQHATVMRVVILEPDQAQDRRPGIGMVAEDFAEPAIAAHAGTDHAKPGMGDLVLEIAVVPRKAGFFDKAGRSILLRRAQR